MVAGAWPALATSWHAKSSGWRWHIGPNFEKSGLPPVLNRAVKPPAEWPKTPMRVASMADRLSQVDNMWSIARLMCCGRSMMKTLRLWSASLSPVCVTATTT